MRILIDPEFEALTRPLSEEELEGLERDLARDGCRDALVVWEQEGADPVLLDGHHRYAICQRLNLPYSVKPVSVASREHARRWILENQIDRRNLDKKQRALLAAQTANLPAHRPSHESAQICAVTQAAAAEKQGISRRTVQHTKRALKNGSPKLLEALNRGIIPPSLASDITKLSQEDQERVAEKCLECGDAQPARAAASKVVLAKRKKRAAAAKPVMDGRQLFAVVLADPWRPEPERLGGRDITIQRCLVAPEKIKKVGRDLAKDLQPDAALFLRVPGPRISDALIIMEAWGFEYCAQLVCPNQGAGLDEYVRYDHELLLIGTRGDDLVPNPADRPTSVIKGEVCQIIEKMYPDSRKLALFPRTELPGWTLWHHETGAAAELGSVAQGSNPVAMGKMLDPEIDLD